MELQVKNELRPCIVNGKKRALLHVIFDGYATVEYESGTFDVIHAESLRMLDSADLFAEHCFTERGE